MSEAEQPGTTTVEPWLDVSPRVVYKAGEGPFGVNLRMLRLMASS